jgi:multicomponent Na+:H+ antiporter subunit D
VLAALAAGHHRGGSLIALRQDNLKRRLAYSTVVHLSYIVLGAALVAPFGMVGS